MSKTTLKIVSKDAEVVHENFSSVAKEVGEDCRHTSLKRRGGVAQSEWHASQGECAKGTCERRLLLIVKMNSNLIVARISIEEAEVTQSCQSVQDLVDEREWEVILFRGRVQLPIADANFPFRWKSCLDLFTLLVCCDCYFGFLRNNVYRTHPLAVIYGVDNFCV